VGLAESLELVEKACIRGRSACRMLGVFASETTSFCRRHDDENVRTALLRIPEPVDDRTAEAKDRQVLNRNAMLTGPIDLTDLTQL